MTETAQPPLERIDLVLVSPKTPGNVGSAARAIKNMGLRRLTIAEPMPIDPQVFEREARRLAVDAGDVLDAMRTFATLDDAVSPATFLIATTGKGRRKVELESLRAAVTQILAVARERPVAILFGPEDHGLAKRLVNRAHMTIAIPSTEEYPSLNLAQAVMLVAYELRMASLPTDQQASKPTVPQYELDGLHRDLRLALEQIDFLKSHNGEAVLARLAGLLVRACPNEEEVWMLRGICRQIRWLESRTRVASSGRQVPEVP